MYLLLSLLGIFKSIQTNGLVSHKTLMSHNYAVSQYKLCRWKVFYQNDPPNTPLEFSICEPPCTHHTIMCVRLHEMLKSSIDTIKIK